MLQITNLEGYGHWGVKVQLNLMDQYSITQMCERIECYLRNSKEIHAETGEEFPMLEELQMILNFLSKLALPRGETSTVFDPKTDEKPEKVPAKATK